MASGFFLAGLVGCFPALFSTTFCSVLRSSWLITSLSWNKYPAGLEGFLAQAAGNNSFLWAQSAAGNFSFSFPHLLCPLATSLVQRYNTSYKKAHFQGKPERTGCQSQRLRLWPKQLQLQRKGNQHVAGELPLWTWTVPKVVVTHVGIIYLCSSRGLSCTGYLYPSRKRVLITPPVTV